MASRLDKRRPIWMYPEGASFRQPEVGLALRRALLSIGQNAEAAGVVGEVVAIPSYPAHRERLRTTPWGSTAFYCPRTAWTKSDAQLRLLNGAIGSIALPCAATTIGEMPTDERAARSGLQNDSLVRGSHSTMFNHRLGQLLSKAGVYKEWQDRCGLKAWSKRESAVGELG